MFIRTRKPSKLNTMEKEIQNYKTCTVPVIIMSLRLFRNSGTAVELWLI
jgi:hypothetical protein